MSYTDTFPIDPDYAVTRSRESNVLRGRVESAREFFRQKAAPQRIFDLVFSRRAVEDWYAIENFRLRMMTDFFTFADKTSGRSYSVYFNTEPIYEEVGNEQVNIRLQLIETVGAALASYPNFMDQNPYVRIEPQQAVNLGAGGLQFVYAGYGFRVNGMYSEIYLDEALTGGQSPNTSVALGLHRVRVVGGAPTSLDYLI